MSTITKEFTKEQLIAKAREQIAFCRNTKITGEGRAHVNQCSALFEIALASIEAEKNAEPVAKVETIGVCWYADNGVPRKPAVGTELYSAPPAPVSVPTFEEWCERTQQNPLGWVRDAMKEAYDGCRAAMLQGVDTELQRKATIHDALCQKYNVESLADFVDWQRKHIAELEAAPPAPVGPGETAVMPDFPGYTMTQRECFQAGKKAGMAEAGSSPIAPDGYALVPVEPTLEMIKAGANAASAGMLIPGMYRAMITAAPLQEVK